MEQFQVTGMSCAACSAHVERAVRGVPGVTDVAVSLLTNSMQVEYGPPATAEQIVAAVEAAGYGASPGLGDDALEVQLKPFKSNDMVAMITVDEQNRRFAEMAARWGNKDMNLPEKRTLVLNAGHPLVNWIKNAEEEASVLVPRGRHLAVLEGDRVRRGQKICDGSVDPHDILRVQGPEAVQRHLVNEIQAVYRLQGVAIADKHLECLVRQMMRKIKISDPGDSDLLPDEEISKARLRMKNDKLRAEGRT